MIDRTWLAVCAASFPEPKNSIAGEDYMNNLFLKLYIKLQNLAKSEQGQELVEYALLCSLIALAAISGVQSVATAVNNVFSNLSNSLG
jgi:Flp pilus assembly pilin Flp